MLFELAGTAVQGRVRGGQQPVSGASVQIYAAGTSGYGSAARTLLSAAVLSGSDGSFTFAGKYSCQTSDLVYLVATGGNRGGAGDRNNSGLALMSGVGPCANLVNAQFLDIDELTTVASVWALSPFMTNFSHVGTSATNVQGLTNAFAAIGNLVDASSGTVPGPNLPAGATIPIAEINTLGDILATCVNSVDNQTPASLNANCGALFNATKTGATTPTDTIQAALNLAQSPATNVATLDSLVPSSAPFQPTLATPPNAWTIAINFTGGGFNAPSAMSPTPPGTSGRRTRTATASPNSRRGIAALGPDGLRFKSPLQPQCHCY